MAYENGGFSGRWFVTDQDITDGRIEAVSETAPPQILALSPASLLTGQATRVVISVTGLTGAPVLPEGVIIEIEALSAQQIMALPPPLLEQEQSYDLAREARKLRPDMKALFLFGHALLGQSSETEHFPLSRRLMKPCTKSELIEIVRELLRRLTAWGTALRHPEHAPDI